MEHYNPNQPRDKTGKWTERPGYISDKIEDNVREEIASEERALELETLAKAKQKIGSPSSGQMFAIENYSEGGYSTMNSALRKDEVPNSFHFARFRQYVEEAPKVEGTFYRGMRFAKEEDFEKFANSIEEGTELMDKGFLSTSVLREMGFDNAAGMYNKASFGGARIKVKGKSGVYIAPFSSKKQEQEIVFPPRTKFRVSDKTISNVDGKKILNLTFTEL